MELMTQEQIRAQLAVSKQQGSLVEVHDFDEAGETFDVGFVLLTDSYQNDLPLVIGTKKYKGGDDFTGVISDLGTIKLTLHYFNSHDLSSLWEYEILLAQIDYVRVRGTQTATARKVLDQVFHQE